MKSRLDLLNPSNYHQTTQSRWKASQKYYVSRRRLGFSEALLDQVSTYVKRGICSVHSEGAGFKNVKSYSYAISSFEEVPRLLEEGYGLLSGT